MSNAFYSYQEEIESIQKQITEIKANLRLVEESKSGYLPTEIPIKLKRDEQKLQEELSKLRQRQGQLVETTVDLRDKSKIISIEPYRLNRVEQEQALFTAIEELNNPNQLLVCLVHGDNLQSQDTLPIRLKKFFFPYALKRDNIVHYHIRFPDNFKNAQDFQAQLQYILARTIPDYGLTKSNEEINNRLIGIDEPIIICANMLACDWSEYCSEVITSFLDFWDNWPSLSPNQRLFVFLFIKYLPQQTRQEHCFLGKIRYLSQERKNAKLNQEIQDLVDKFSQSKFSQFSNFHGTVLPILQGITKQQALDWVDRVSSHHFSDNVDFILETKREIKAIFDRYQSQDSPKRIPMDDLSLRLKGILYEYTARREIA